MYRTVDIPGGIRCFDDDSVDPGYRVDEGGVTLISKDVGPGIPDIGKALEEGYSTASEEARDLGFGAGMGLPNMKRNADRFEIESQVGVGTTIKMAFALKR